MKNRSGDQYPKRSKKRHKTQRRKPMNPSTQKGRILERIVAAMYESPGITVKTNVDYPTTDGKDTREVDILLTANLEGLPVEYIFQCKNELKPIGEPILDGFVGHLNDIGVQTKYAIF